MTIDGSTGTAGPTFTLHVNGPREEMLRYSGSASVELNRRSPRWHVRNYFTLLRAIGLMLLVIGVMLAILGQIAVAIPVWFAGALLVLNTRYKVVARRFTRILARDPNLGSPAAYTLDRSGMRYQTGTEATEIAWTQASEVVDHEGGLLLVFEGAVRGFPIPPSAFQDQTHRTQVLHQVQQWVTAARGASNAGIT